MATEARPLLRLDSLDTVRGVAVMGILLMNIVAFSMPEAAYMNPKAYGGDRGLDLGIYLVNFVLVDGKMRGLFSFLFGASTLLVIERATAKGESAARVHYMRMIWLLLFGLVHLWLMWWGDILNLYALVGMIAFAFRNKSVRALILWGIGLLFLQCLLVASVAGAVAMMIAGAATEGPNQAIAVKGLANFQDAFGVPPADKIAANLALFRGDYASIVSERFAKQAFGPISGVMMFGAETLAYMLFGMAALKSGLLAGTWPRGRYVKWLAIGFGIGIPFYSAIAWWLVSSDFSLTSVTAGLFALSTPARPLMIVGWACLIILLMRPGGALTTRIAAAGRMAFTNYLTTSLICTTLFYGYGFGWYGYLSRAEIYLVVLGVWALMLIWSKPWLAHFRYGPFEWLWRTLARGRFQPIRGSATAGA